MKKTQLLFILCLISSILSLTARSQDILEYNDLMKSSVSIRAVEITKYKNSPLEIDGHLKWSKGIWKWLINKSIFTDSLIVSKEKIEGSALIKDICCGDGIVDIVVSIDSELYEIISIAKNNKTCGLEKIEIGEEYPLSLFPFYNYPFTMAYHRNEPIYLDGHVIWIMRRKLHSNIYISPDIEDVFYNPAIDAEKKIFELIDYRE